MDYIIRQISSLEKIRVNDSLNCDEIHKRCVLAGERVSYQICLKPDSRTTGRMFAQVSVKSDLDNVKLD